MENLKCIIDNYPSAISIMTLYLSFQLVFIAAGIFYFPALVAYFYQKFNATPWSWALKLDAQKWKKRQAEKKGLTLYEIEEKQQFNKLSWAMFFLFIAIIFIILEIF